MNQVYYLLLVTSGTTGGGSLPGVGETEFKFWLEGHPMMEQSFSESFQLWGDGKPAEAQIAWRP